VTKSGKSKKAKASKAKQNEAKSDDLDVDSNEDQARPDRKEGTQEYENSRPHESKEGTGAHGAEASVHDARGKPQTQNQDNDKDRDSARGTAERGEDTRLAATQIQTQAVANHGGTHGSTSGESREQVSGQNSMEGINGRDIEQKRREADVHASDHHAGKGQMEGVVSSSDVSSDSDSGRGTSIGADAKERTGMNHDRSSGAEGTPNAHLKNDNSGDGHVLRADGSGEAYSNIDSAKSGGDVGTHDAKAQEDQAHIQPENVHHSGGEGNMGNPGAEEGLEIPLNNGGNSALQGGVHETDSGSQNVDR
jgi:hypothetical protein